MEANQLSHRYIANTALPYVPNISVTDKEPQFDTGSNVMTSQKQYAERRNGFTNYISDTTFTFSGTLKRFYTWRRWTGASVTLSGAFFVMYNDVSSTTSRVWKQRVGTDAVPVLIHTDSASTNPFDFVVSNDFIFFGDGVDMKKYDGTTVTNWGITAPSAAVTFTSAAGSLSPVVGYQWVVCFGNSSTGHLSSPSPVSTSTTGTSRKYTISGNTTSDTQVDRVHIFRTLDGGSIYFENPSSPIAYSTWTASGFEDNTADSAMSSNLAPLQNQNNRPTASFDPVWFANRIWTHANDTLYYSDYEELVRGVEEEAFASVNFRSFGTEITCKKVAGEYLLIYTADTIYRIYGDSLATFRMDTLARGKGAVQAPAVVAVDDLVAWLDSSNTVWITDGSTMTELSVPIRSDISSITQSSAAMTIYKNANFHWIILMDGGAGKLRVYDMDTKQWMPPWSISTITAIYSGSVALGTPKLFLAKSNKPTAQDTGYQDDGSSYTASVNMSLLDIVDTENPAEYGVVDHIEVETNSVVPSSVKYLTDDDPSTAPFNTALTSISPPNRTQGSNLVETWYPILTESTNVGARRMAVQLNWAAANTNFKLYGFALAYKVIK